MTAIEQVRIGAGDLAAGDVELAPPSVADTSLVQIRTRAAGESIGRRPRVPRAVERLLGVVVLLGAWAIATSAGWISPNVIAGPDTVLTAGWDLLRDGTLGSALWVSVQRVWWGLLIGIPVGTTLAVFAGLSRVGEDLIDANVQMLRFVPIIGIESVLILSLGIGESLKITMIVLAVSFPVYINTYNAIRSIDPRWGELSDVVGLTRRQRLRRIVLPAALPGFLVGVRLAIAVAWLVLVFAEQVNASTGIGHLMIEAQGRFASDVVVVCLVVYAVLGLATDALVRFLDARLLRWQPGR